MQVTRVLVDHDLQVVSRAQVAEFAGYLGSIKKGLLVVQQQGFLDVKEQKGSTVKGS